MRKPFLSIQYLRAVAALLVVMAHTTEYPISAGGAVPFWTARTGNLGVQIFFVISGFIIITVAGPARFDPLAFAWKRLIRIVPLYWLSTVLLLAATFVAPTLFKTTALNWPHAALSLFFIPHPDPGYGANYWSPLLKPGWTLNLEMFFYAATALLFWCRTMRLRAILLTLVLGTLAVLSFTDMMGWGVLAFYANPNLFAFLAGIWIAVSLPLALSDGVVLRRICGIVCLLSAGALVLVYGTAWPMRETPWTLLAAPLVVMSAVLVEATGGLPVWSGLKRVGDASYSLYLTHMFSVGLAWAMLRHLGPAGAWTSVLGVALSIGFAVLVSLASYRLLETPILRMARSRPHDSTGPRQSFADSSPPMSGSGRPERTIAPWRATRA